MAQDPQLRLDAILKLLTFAIQLEPVAIQLVAGLAEKLNGKTDEQILNDAYADFDLVHQRAVAERAKGN